jgi:hypothetical protein
MLVLPEAERKIYAALMSIKSKHEKRIKDFQLLEEKLRLRELNRKKHEPEFEIDSSESS